MSEAINSPEAKSRGFRPYPKYKDSGVEWLGDIPAHWEAKRLKLVSFINMGQSPSSDIVNTSGEGLPFLQGNADFGTEHPTAQTFCPAPPKIAELRDVLLSVRAPVGALNLADQKYGIGRGLCAIRPYIQILEHAFCHYVLQIARHQLDELAKGSTYDAVSSSEVSCLIIPLPSIKEQRAIAAFLDREKAKIDAFIEKKERLIKLLQEKRTALITQAVTKGLDPTVRMKDSGIEWLGKIPAHWEMKPLKYFLKSPLAYGVLKPDKHQGDDGVRLIRILDVESGQVYEDQLELISPEQSEEFSRTIVRSGDLVVSVVGTIGRSFVVPTSLAGANLSRALARVQLKQCLEPSFLEYCFASSPFASFVELVPAGTAQRVLNLGDLAECMVAAPVRTEEQRQIVRGLNEKAGAISSLIDRIHNAIDRLREYRTALISGAVTGKIDVKGLC